MKPDVSKTFHRLEKLAQCKYFVPSRIHLDEDQMYLIGMSYYAVTNNRSKFPIIGTDMLQICTGLILYCPKFKVASVTHQITLTPENFQRAYSLLNSGNEKVDAYIAGVKFEHGNIEATLRRKNLDIAINAIEEAGVTIKSFDIGSKPHPTGFAIDTRNGRIIKLTPLLNGNEPFYFMPKPYVQKRGMPKDFDGTAPGMLKMREL